MRQCGQNQSRQYVPRIPRAGCQKGQPQRTGSECDRCRPEQIACPGKQQPPDAGCHALPHKPTVTGSALRPLSPCRPLFSGGCFRKGFFVHMLMLLLRIRPCISAFHAACTFPVFLRVFLYYTPSCVRILSESGQKSFFCSTSDKNNAHALLTENVCASLLYFFRLSGGMGLRACFLTAYRTGIRGHTSQWRRTPHTSGRIPAYLRR